MSRYVRERLLGQGTFGEVYLARDTMDDSEKAIKILVSGVESSLSEIDVLFRVVNPQLVEGYEINIVNRHVELVEQLISGSMETDIFNNPEFLRLSQNEKLNLYYLLVIDCCRGLNCLYQSGYVHLDIKPENILYSLNEGRYTFYIGDYGLAYPRNMDVPLEVDIGTPLFFPPEYKDIPIYPTESLPCWALGFSLIEIITGRDILSEFDYEDTSTIVERAETTLGSFFRMWNPELRGRINNLVECILNMIKIDPSERITPGDALVKLNGRMSSCNFSSNQQIFKLERIVPIVNDVVSDMSPKIKLLAIALACSYTGDLSDSDVTQISCDIINILCHRNYHLKDNSIDFIKNVGGKLLNPHILNLTDDEASHIISEIQITDE